MSEHDAWAAGLFEGEGNTQYSKRAGYSATLAMTDEPVVRRFGEVMGFGKVYGPYRPRNPKHSEYWAWKVTNRAGVAQLLERLGPWLGARRVEQLEEVLWTSSPSSPVAPTPLPA